MKQRRTFEQRMALAARRLRKGGQKVNRTLLEGVPAGAEGASDLQLAQGLAQMAQGFGGLLLGCWLELHRIADAMEEMNRDD